MKDQARGRAEAQSRSKGRMIWITAGALAVIAVIIFGTVYWLTHNYAQDAAKPLERVLTNGGAVKVCTQGDAGRGPDNFAPGYEARYAPKTRLSNSLLRQLARMATHSLISHLLTPTFPGTRTTLERRVTIPALATATLRSVLMSTAKVTRSSTVVNARCGPTRHIPPSL